MEKRDLPPGWDKDIPTFAADAKGLATRESSGQVLNAIAKNVPWIVGGAADLNPSTKTFLKFEGAGTFTAQNPGGRNIHFGIREHGMGAILNGMTLAKLRAYGSGFLIFSDYGRPSIRLGALMHIPPLYVFTHESIGVGEDGPTHQPIEQLMSLRAMPNLLVIRPCDANEVVEAYKIALTEKHAPIDPCPDSPGGADARPREVRAGVGTREGRIRAQQRAEARCAAHRHRQRGSTVR